MSREREAEIVARCLQDVRVDLRSVLRSALRSKGESLADMKG